MTTESHIRLLDKKCQIVSDGERMIVLMPGVGAIEVLDPIARNFSISVEHQNIMISGSSSSFPIAVHPFSSSFNLELTGRRAFLHRGDIRLQDFDLFEKMSIRDLLSMVEKKIERRK